ncbi:4637_t:CDS:2 [Acaulospora morrowiae]|uniref:4637_t:CDS:1 n=1 Tax=Acaulospora morrowiae TaxID=94023 RepID=A0A9N8ZI62_9GLOM|nr:4637_t:CDS:2 [Acaulospora morrowiae]
MSKEISLKSFVTIVDEIHQAYKKMRDLYEFAEYNRQVCNALIHRVDSVEFKLRDMLRIRMNEDDESYKNMKFYKKKQFYIQENHFTTREFYSHESYLTMQQLLNNIYDMEKFIDELSHLRTYFTGKSIETTFYELTKEFDMYVKALNIKIDVDANSESVSLTMDIKSFEKNKLNNNKVKQSDENNPVSTIKQDSLASSLGQSNVKENFYPAEQDFLDNCLRITYDTKINDQKKVNIPGLEVYCEVEGNRQSDVELLELLRLHEEEIFNILPTSAIGIGITFVKSYQEPSIILYVNILSELSEQTIENFFEILQRPPEDIVICQLFDEDKPNNSAERRENKGNENDPNEVKEYNKDNEGATNESQKVIYASANVHITSNNNSDQFGQAAYIQFKLKMQRLKSTNDELKSLKFEIFDIIFSGGEMLSSKISNLKGEGYYPIKAEVILEPKQDLSPKILSRLITSINLNSPSGEMNVIQNRIETKNVGTTAGVNGINPNLTVNSNKEITINEKVSSVRITNPNLGFPNILWEHDLRNEERRLPNYSEAPVHTACIGYKDVKKFEVRATLTLEYNDHFISGLIKIIPFRRVIKLPKRLRFSFSIIIAENQIQNIFRKNGPVYHCNPEALQANQDNIFEDLSENDLANNGIVSSQNIKNLNLKKQ